MAKIPQFARLKSGDYAKLQEAIDEGIVKFPSYVYDEAAQRLIWINEDGTYSYIKGDSEAYTVLVGTPESPIRIANLEDGMYLIEGNYVIKNTDVDYVAKAPILVLIETDEEKVYATLYTSNGFVIYVIDGDSTTIDRPVTEETVVGVVNTAVEEQVPAIVEEVAPSIIEEVTPGIIEEVAPSIIEENIEPVPDQDIDDMIDNLFPDYPPPNNGDYVPVGGD